MTIFSSIFRFLLFLGLITEALYADDGEYETYFKTTCDPQSNAVTYQIIYSNEAPHTNTKCTFANGKTVEVKFGGDEALPYGECGATPEQYFSLWFDKKKILSKTPYTQRCQDESEIKSINIQNNTITTCTYATTGEAITLNINKNKVSCSTKIIDMNQPRDEIEYPLVGAKIPVGTIILQYAFDKSLCQAFTNGRLFTSIKPLKSFNYSVNQLDKMSFDINNDGKNETVYRDSRLGRDWGRHEYSHFYVIDTNNVSKINTQFDALATQQNDTEEFAKKVDHFIQQLATLEPPSPESWGANKNPERLRINTIKKTIDMPTNAEPVMYQGKIYLQFSSNELTGLLHYKSSKHFEEICIAKVVEETY